MELEHVVEAINDYQEKHGGDRGLGVDQLQYSEIVDDGENEITIQSNAYGKEVYNFVVETECGKIVKVYEM